jgi:cytochrome c-type biogenesis protein CcmE
MNRIAVKIGITLAVFAGAIGYLAFAGAKQAWVYHLTVDQFLASPQYKMERVRLCGPTEKDRFFARPGSLEAKFILKGTGATVPVEYRGVIPEMFKAGCDVVVEGKLDTAGVFQADLLMTKCASKYEAKAAGAS